MKIETMEKKIFEAIKEHGGFAATYVIASMIGRRGKTQAIREIMKKLEEKGKVKRHKYTQRNNIVWEISE